MQVSRSSKTREKPSWYAYSQQRLPEYDHFEENMEISFAKIWEEAMQNHITQALPDTESIRYVPHEIRRKMAAKPLLIRRYE